MKVLGLLVLAFGAVLFFVVGRNYDACQSVWVQADSANNALCGTAYEGHLFGIIAMIGGGLWLGIALLLPPPE